MPFIWLCFVFDMLSIVTGIGLKKADGSMVTPLFKKGKRPEFIVTEKDKNTYRRVISAGLTRVDNRYPLMQGE